MYKRNAYPTFIRLLLLFLFTVYLQETCIAQEHQACGPSSCGKISNISHPFRLKQDPPNCGNHSYELACENNITVLYLFSRRYYVESINYNNFTIRIVDPSVQQTDCSSIPRYFLDKTNFSDAYFISSGDAYEYQSLFQHVLFLNCSKAVTDDPEYVDTAPCINWNSNGHIYAVARNLTVQKLKVGCRVMKIAATSLWGLEDYDYTHNQIQSFSYNDIHRALVFGFEVSWVNAVCKDICVQGTCYYNNAGEVGCFNTDSCFSPLGIETRCGSMSNLRIFAEEYVYGLRRGLLQIIGAEEDWSFSTADRPYNRNDSGIVVGEVSGHYILPYIAARFLFGFIFLFSLLTYTWRRRHISIYGNIEDFLQGNNLMPIRYSYNEIKKMTRGFSEKLGEGGFGLVYKGKLQSGSFVAIKMLGKAKANGEEFISEVATIGKIHHSNVVQLVGFCFEGLKHALVYEFMPNGSLDKYIFSEKDSMLLSYEKIYEISLGVARGIAYLHQGCETQILHFDIKPHNVLLDENFNPKISDFGLAKLCPIDDSFITMTAARGTIGYMAPELFYDNIGGVSYKADVYSFGMLLMEMTSRRKNFNSHADHSSQLYFPFWIYDQFSEEKNLEIEGVTEEEKNIAKKMCLVALWCIQMKPCNRPSMNKVVEMLEGGIESLEMPPKPTLYPHETIVEDASSSFSGFSNNLKENASVPLLENSG